MRESSYLQEQNADGSLRRTVSLDNLVTREAGFHVSAPALTKPKVGTRAPWGCVAFAGRPISTRMYCCS